MFELTYSSIATPNIKPAHIQAILKTATSFNADNQITGCLLFHNGQFTQILEGRKEIIMQLYAKIEQDKRHHQVKLLSVGEKEKRTFADWSMAYMEMNNSQLNELSDPLFEHNLLFFSELSDKPTQAVKLFWEKVSLMIQH